MIKKKMSGQTQLKWERVYFGLQMSSWQDLQDTGQTAFSQEAEIVNYLMFTSRFPFHLVQDLCPRNGEDHS